MALSQAILNETELAKAKITSCESLDDDYKKQLLNVLHLTTVATNGISPEEKIQKMTEAIHLLTVSQISFITGVEQTVRRSIESANMKQCDTCQAMRHARQIEEKEKEYALIENWKRANGLQNMPKFGVQQSDLDADDSGKEKSWTEVFKELLMKPYVYVFLTLVFISPYGVQILEKILAVWSK